MGVKTSVARTSAADLETAMRFPSEERIRLYAEEVLGDFTQAERWLGSKVASLDSQTPESLLRSQDPELMRRVLATLIQIDYGVVG